MYAIRSYYDYGRWFGYRHVSPHIQTCRHGRRLGFIIMEAEVDAGKPLSVSRRQLAWLLFCRILVTALFLGGTLIYHVRGGPENGHAAHFYLFLLFGLTFA